MKEFEFLEERAHYAFTGEFGEFVYYHFKKINEATGYISICRKTGIELKWMIVEHDGEKFFGSGNETECIKHIFPWFYETVKEASASLEKRDKIRKLFL